MIKIQIDFISKSIGPFELGNNISDYISIYPNKFNKGKDEWDEFLFFDEDIEVYVDLKNEITAIACRNSCFAGDLNLIGLGINEFIKTYNFNINKIKSEKLWVSDHEQQDVYSFDEFDLQLWTDSNKKIVTVFLG